MSELVNISLLRISFFNCEFFKQKNLQVLFSCSKQCSILSLVCFTKRHPLSPVI